MTPLEHWNKAGKLLAQVEEWGSRNEASHSANIIAAAKVHAYMARTGFANNYDRLWEIQDT